MYKSIELSPRKDGLRGYYGSVFDQTKQIRNEIFSQGIRDDLKRAKDKFYHFENKKHVKSFNSKNGDLVTQQTTLQQTHASKVGLTTKNVGKSQTASFDKKLQLASFDSIDQTLDSLPRLQTQQIHFQSKKQLYALNHPFDSKQYGQKMIDKMRETIANQAFLDTKNLSKKQSDHMKNIRLNRQIQNESLIFDQEFTQHAMRNNKSKLLIQTNRAERKIIRSRNINNQSIVLPELPSLEVTLKRHKIPTPKIPINYAPNGNQMEDPLHSSNFFQSKKLQEQLQQEQRQLLIEQQQSESNTRLIVANSNTNLQSQSLKSLNKLNQVTDTSQKVLKMLENSSKKLVNVPSTVIKKSKKGKISPLNKREGEGAAKKAQHENIDNIIKQSLQINQIRSVSNSPDLTVSNEQAQKEKSKKSEERGLENSASKRTSKLKLFMNQQQQQQIRDSSKQLSSYSNEGSPVNSIYKLSREMKRKSVTDKVDFGTDVMSPNQQDVTPMIETSKSVSKDVTQDRGPETFDKDEDEFVGPQNDNYYTFNEQFPNYPSMKKVKRKKREGHKDLSQTLTNSLKNLNQMSSRQLLKQHPRQEKNDQDILKQSLKQLNRKQMARFEAQNHPQSMQRRKNYHGLYSKNDRDLHNNSLDTDIEIQNHQEYLRSLSPDRHGQNSILLNFEQSQRQQNQQVQNQMRASQQEFLKKFNEQHRHNQKQMQKWNGMNQYQYKLKITTYEQNAINGLENQISVMQSEERKKFMEFVQGYEGDQSQILNQFQQKYKELPGAQKMIKNQLKKQSFRSSKGMQQFARSHDFRSSVYSKNSITNSNGSGKQATRINDKHSSPQGSDQKFRIEIPTQQIHNQPPAVQTALSPVNRNPGPVQFMQNMELNIENSLQNQNAGQRNNTLKTENTMPNQNTKTANSPFMKQSDDGMLKIQRIRNKQSIPTELKTYSKKATEQLISQSPQSINFKNAVDYSIATQIQSPSLVNIAQSKYLHPSDSKDELSNGLGDSMIMKPKEMMSAGNQINLETPTIVSPNGLKRGLSKFRNHKIDKQPAVVIKPKMIDMNQQVQLSQNTSNKLIIPKFQTISNSNIIDSIIREENLSRKKVNKITIEDSQLTSSNQHLIESYRNTGNFTKLVSPQTQNINLEHIISNEAILKGNNSQLNHIIPLSQSSAFDQQLIKFNRTFNQHQEPTAAITRQFIAGPVRKMPSIRYANKSNLELDNSLENSHSIQQIVKQNSSTASFKFEQQGAHDNQQRIMNSLKGFTSLSSQKKLESLPSIVQIKGVFGNTIDLKGKTPFSPKVIKTAARASPIMSPNSQDLTNILNKIQSQSESQRLEHQVQHLNFDLSQDKPIQVENTSEGDKTFALQQNVETNEAPTNIRNSRLASQENQEERQEVILVMGKKKSPRIQGIIEGTTETPTRSVEITSQNMIKNIITGKLADGDSASVSQADEESGKMNREQSLDMIREPSFQPISMTLTPEKDRANISFVNKNKSQFQRVVYQHPQQIVSKDTSPHYANAMTLSPEFPRIETEFIQTSSPSHYTSIRVSQMQESLQGNANYSLQERQDAQDAYVTLVAAQNEQLPEEAMPLSIKKGFRGQKYENPNLQQKLQKMIQYNLNTNFNEIVFKSNERQRSTRNTKTLSPNRTQQNGFNMRMDKVQQYQVEVLQKYTNKNEQLEQAMKFAQNFSSPKNRFNQTFGDPFMNKSINNPNSQLTFLKAQQKISKSRLGQQGSPKKNRESERDSKMSPHRESALAGPSRTVDLMNQKEVKFTTKNTDPNDTSQPNKTPNINQEQATFSNDEGFASNAIEPMYSPRQSQENFMVQDDPTPGLQDNMDAITKKTEDRVQPDESISAIDHQDNQLMLMKTQTRNPFNQTHNQQNIQTLLTKENEELSENQDERLVTIQNDENKSFIRNSPTRTRQSQDELEERDSFDGSPNRKLESPTSPGDNRKSSQKNQLMLQYVKTGGRHSKLSASQQRISPLQNNEFNVLAVPQQHIRDPYNPILNQSYNMLNTEQSENFSVVGNLVPNYIQDHLQNQAITQSNFVKKKSFSPSKIVTKKVRKEYEFKEYYRTIATSPIPEIIESKKQSMMITPANGDSMHITKRSDGLDQFSESKDPLPQMFISSKISPKGISQIVIPKIEKEKQGDASMSLAQKQKTNLQKQEQQKDKQKQQEKQKKSILKQQKSRSPEEIDYELKRTFLIQSLSSKAIESNADLHTSRGDSNSVGQKLISGQTIYKNNSKERAKKKISMRMDNVPFLQQDIEQMMTENNFYGTRMNQTITIMNENGGESQSTQNLNTPFGMRGDQHKFSLIGKGKLIQPSPLRKLKQLSSVQQELLRKTHNSDYELMRETQEIQRQVQENTYKNPFHIEGEQINLKTIKSQESMSSTIDGFGKNVLITSKNKENQEKIQINDQTKSLESLQNKSSKMRELGDKQSTMTLLKHSAFQAGTDQVQSRDRLTTNLSKKQLLAMQKKDTLALNKSNEISESNDLNDTSKFNRDLLQIKTPMDVDSPKNSPKNTLMSKTLKQAKTKSPPVMNDIGSLINSAIVEEDNLQNVFSSHTSKRLSQ